MGSEDEAPIVDRTVWGHLHADVGKEVVSRLVARYREDAPERVEQMRRALARSDLEGMSAAGHALKSASAMLGLSALAELCRQVEQADELETAKALFPKLEEAHRRGLDALAALSG